MSCEVVVRAENGQPSVLYNELLNITNNAEVAHRLYLQTKRDNFKQWFGTNNNSVIDGNNEPKIIEENGEYVFKNTDGKTKSIYNNGTFGKQNKPIDVINYLRNEGIVSKKTHLDKFWIKKGITVDGNNLIERNLRSLDRFNSVYYRDFGFPLVYAYKRGTSYEVEVNEVLLNTLNSRNQTSLYYSSVEDIAGDMNSNAMRLATTSQNLTAEEESYGINIIGTFVMHFSEKLTSLTMKDAVQGNTVRGTITNNIIAISRDRLNNKEITEQQHNVNSKIANEVLNNDLFWDKIKHDIEFNSGFIVTELDDLQAESDEIANSFDENQQFKVAPDERVRTTVKKLINTTPILSTTPTIKNGKKVYGKDTSSVGGLSINMRFADVSDTLVQIVSGVTSVSDMMSKLEFIADNVNPSFKNIVTKLKLSNNLKNAFFSSFKNEGLERIVTTINPNSKTGNFIATDVSNKSSYNSYSIANNWINTLNMYKSSDFYELTGSINDIISTYSKFNRATGNEKVDLLEKFFKLVGVNIDRVIIDSILSQPEYRKAKSESDNDTTVKTAAINNIFGLAVQDIYKYVNYTGKMSEITKDVKILGNLLKLAKTLNLYYNSDGSSYLNAENNIEQTFNKSTFLAEWFDMMKDDTVFLEHLKNLIRNPKTRFSNWLLTYGNREGFLKMPEGVNTSNLLDNIDRLELNKDFYYDSKKDVYKVKPQFLDGINHLPTNTSMRYTDIVDSDWNYVSIAHFFAEDEYGNVKYFLISPADRGNTRLITAPKIRLNPTHLSKNLELSVKSPLFKAVKRIIKGEIARINNEYNFVFDENGNVIKDVDMLYLNYHYKLDGNNNPIFIDDEGNPVGDAFKIHNFGYIDKYGTEFNINNLFKDENDNSYVPDATIFNDEDIVNNIDKYIKRMLRVMTEKQIQVNSINKRIIQSDILKNRDYKQSLFEYTVNRFIANNEMGNLFMGDSAFYGSPDSANKRATQLLASGVVNGNYGTNLTFNAVTALDRYITHDNFISRIETALRAQNQPEEIVEFITNSYKDLNSTDAQSYITIEEFKNRLRMFGVYDKYEHLIEKVEDRTQDIDVADLNEFANALKNFYYSYEFDGHRFVPVQVKNSEQILIPRFIEGTELEEIYNVMKANNIAQLNFVSAEKVGTKYPANIVEDNGNLKLDVLTDEFKKASNKYFYKNLRKQQEAVNHIIDTQNKLGTQIAKKIIDNVSNDAVVSELFSLYVANINEAGVDLLDYIGVSLEGNEYVINYNRLSEILIDAGVSRGFINNTLEGFQLDDDGTFKLPLDHITNRISNEHMVNSLFTNRVINQKFSGAHGPQMSDAFFRTIENKKVVESEDLQYSTFVSKNGNFSFIKAQIKLPYWSKRFFAREDDEHSYSKITIEDLKAAGLDTMIGYRIPTEAKYSMVVFEIAEFLDASAGSTIIVPAEFNAQTGADFDFDSIYTMIFNFKRMKDGTLRKVEYTTEDEQLEDRYINYVNANYRGPVKNEIALEIRAKAERSYAAYKANRTKLRRETAQTAKEEMQALVETINTMGNKAFIDDVLGHIESLSKYNLSYAEGLSFLSLYVSERLSILDGEINNRTQNVKRNQALFDKFLMLQMYVEDSVNYVRGEMENVDEYNAKIAEKMDERYWSSFSIEVAKRTAELVGLDSIDEFSNKPIELQNTKEARDNRILQLYIDILSDFNNYLEVASPSMFVDTLEAKNLVEDVYSKFEKVVNFYDPYTQDSYRKRALAGRKLKGISVNRDSFISVAQRVGLNLKYAVRYKFDIKAYPIEQLNKIFGEDAVEADGTVLMSRFGKNAEGGFTNVDNKLITSYAAQSTAHILDSVKFPLPFNVTDFTFNVWRLIPELGGTWNSATLLISQEGVTGILKRQENNTSINVNRYGDPIKLARYDLLKRILYLNRNNKAFVDKVPIARKFARLLNENGIGKYVPAEVLDAISNEYFKSKVLSDKDLLNNLKKIGTKMSIEEETSYLFDQVNVVDFYKELTDIVEQISDFQILTGFDKNRVGPTFADNDRITDLIKKVTNADTSSDQVYNNILLTGNGNHYFDEIYSEDSSYPSLRAYFENGIALADDIFRNEFITNSPPFSQLLKSTPRALKGRMTSYTMAKVLSEVPFFNDTDVNQLMGSNKLIEDINLNEITDDNVSKFEKLSVANKLLLVKKYYNEYIDKSNVLYYINPIIDDTYFDRNKGYGISFVLDKNSDNLISSFNKMWYNHNPFYHLLAKDIVKYAYFRYGLNFGRNVSKLIPTNILYKEPSVIELINGIEVTEGIGYTSQLHKQRLRHFDMAQAPTYDLFHRIRFARTNTNNKSIVPTLYSKDEFGYPKFSPNKEGIVAVSEKEFWKLDRDVRNADVVEKWRGTKEKGKYTQHFYAKIPITYRKAGNEESNKTYYYLPVNKLESYEFNEVSRIAENNKVEPIDHYITLLKTQLTTNNYILDDVSNELLEGINDDPNKTVYSSIEDLIEKEDEFVEYNRNIIDHIRAITSDYSLQARVHPNNELLATVSRRLNKIDYGTNLYSGVIAAIRADADYAYRAIKEFEERIYDVNGYISKEKILEAVKNPDDRVEFTSYMNRVNSFLTGLNRISKLETIKRDALAEEEKELNKAIARLTSLASRVNELKATHSTIMNFYFEKLLTPISTNPEIKLGIRRMFDVQSDESKIQLFLDALIDTNHSFVANFIKKKFVENGIVDEEIKTLQTKFDKDIEDFKNKGFRIEDIIDRDNKLIQEFDEKYKEDLDNLKLNLSETEEKYGKYSKQYYEAERKLKKWQMDNLLSEEMPDLENAKFEANDILYKHIEARKRRDAIQESRRTILNNYEGVMDYSVMTMDDIMSLKKLKYELDYLANRYNREGNLKTGEELAIAETLIKYNEAMSKVFEKYYVPVIAVKEFEELLNKYKTLETPEAKAWLLSNTKVGINSNFWDDFKEHSAILEREGVRDPIMDALKPYRDNNGIVNGTAIPKAIREKIKAANEGRVSDVEPRNPKAIEKPKDDNFYTDRYYYWFENRGQDSRDDNEDVQALRDQIRLILFKYINTDGLLDTTKISKDDYKELQKLEDEIRYKNMIYIVSHDRDGFNKWYNETHDRRLVRDRFEQAKKDAYAISDSYGKAWEAGNTELRFEKDYYKILEELKNEYKITKKVTTGKDEDMAGSQGLSVNMDSVRRFFKVQSVKELPKDVYEAIVSARHHNMYDSAEMVYTLSDFMKSHKVLKRNAASVGRRAIIGKSYEEAAGKAADMIKAQYLKRLDKDKRKRPTSKRPTMYRDARTALYDYTTTPQYNRLLKKHGKWSQWYIDNHVIDHKGNIVPAHYWVVERPKDKSLYEENAPASKYWGYNVVTDPTFVDKTKSKSKAWMNENANYVPTRYYEDVASHKKATLSDPSFRKWFDDNHFFNRYTNKYEPISIWTTIMPSNDYVDNYAPVDYAVDRQVKEEYINPDFRHINNKPLPRKDSKYYNKNFNEISNSPLYKYLNDLLLELTAHYEKDSIINEQQLPIMYKTKASNASELYRNFLRNLGWFSYPSREVVGENNDGVRILNMQYVSNLMDNTKNWQPIELPKEKEFDTREEYLARYNEVRRRNKEIKEHNDQYNRDYMNKDWISVIRTFIAAAKKHKFVYESEDEMRLALEQIRNLDLAKRRTLSENLKNITRIKLGKDKPSLYEGDTGIATTKGTNSNLEQHFRLFMSMVFYGEFEEDEGSWTKIARVLQNFTSAKGMWLNGPGAFNNVAYGRTQMALEHWAGYYYTKQDAFKADKLYVSSMFNMIYDIGKDKSSNLVNALLRKYDVLNLQDELAISSNKELDKSIKKHLISTNSMYFMHHMGEHYMQNIALLAMLNSNRLVGDEVKSLTEYTFDLQYNALQNVLDAEGKHELDKFIRDNKYVDRYFDGKGDLIRDFILSKKSDIKVDFLKTLKELKESAKKDFESYTKLWDIYEFNDGEARVKDGYNLSDEQFQLFKLKVVKVNQKVHGIYNKFDAGTIQRYALGRLAVQFKKWLRPGFIKRFGTRIGKAHWNEARNELDRGMYVSFFNFLTKPIGDAIREAKGEEGMAVQVIGKILSNYTDYIRNLGLYWHTLNDSDKANVRRTITETLEFASVMIALWILRGLADGDEDDKKWAYALYAADRLKTEILAYNPFYGFTNESRKLMRDPFAAMAMMEDAVKLVYTGLFESDKVYKGGIYHGERKFDVQVKKNVPLLNRYLRYQNIQDYAGYYKLY